MDAIKKMFHALKSEQKDTEEAQKSFDKVFEILSVGTTSGDERDTRYFALCDAILDYEEQGFARGFAYAMSLQQALAKVEKERETA